MPNSTANAAPVAAGSVFNSTAHASYAAAGLTASLTSNTVTTVIQPLQAERLTGNQTLGGLATTSVAFAHRLTNTGDVTTAYTLTVGTVGGNFGAAGITLVSDTNGNGSADPGEPLLASGTSVTLAAGTTLNLVLVATVPGSAATGQFTQIRLTATPSGTASSSAPAQVTATPNSAAPSSTPAQGATTPNGAALSASAAQGTPASVTDTLDVIGPIIAVTLNASLTKPVAGGVFDYLLSTRNSGTSVANPTAVTVNAQPAALFLLRAIVPANTLFAGSSSPTAGAQLLYHRLGDPPGSYVTTLPPTSSIDGVAWGLAALPAGAALSGTLGVTVNGNASGTLSATGYSDYAVQGNATTAVSGTLTLTLPPLAPTITFYTGGSFALPTKQVGLGAPLYVQINAAQCNTDRGAILTHPLTLVSALTGDSETFSATETAPNTGLFRIMPYVPTASAATHAVVSGDGILEVQQNDRVTATLAGCGAGSSSAVLLIDPSGTVFNSKSNAPIPGAVVELIDVTGAGNGGHPGGAAAVFAADEVTPAPSTFTTASNGTYDFPFVPPSTYKLMVVPPNGLSFPSKLPPASLPAGRNVIATTSYGGSFTISATSGPITTDIPIDSSAAGGLFIQKTASKSVAAIGDFVDYSLTISNNTGLSLPAVIVSDDLPVGFAFIVGSARLNGVTLTNPAGGAGPTLTFGVGTLAPTTQALLTYRVRIGPAGQTGNGINTAKAGSGPTQSNLATAAVKVTGSALSDKAYVFGKVYADCNHNRVQDADEPGIPGVRIYLDNGTYVVTDIEGKYSIYGLTPRTYVAKLDTTSLPQGTTLRLLDNRNALDAGSQFVDLQNGELHKTDFAIADCNAALNDAVAARRQALHGARSEITALATTQIAVNPTPVSDPRALNASGIVGQRNTVPGAADGIATHTASPDIAPSVAGTPAVTPTATATPASASISASAMTPAPTASSGAASLPVATPASISTEAQAVMLTAAAQQTAASAKTSAPTATPMAVAAATETPTTTPTEAEAVVPAAAATVTGMAAAQPPTSASPTPTPMTPANLTAADLSPSYSLAQLLPTLTARLDFLYPPDGAVVHGSQTRVRVKGAFGTQLKLLANGKAVSLAQVGEQDSLESQGVTAWEYIGVDLAPGENELELVMADSFGNPRDTRRLHLTVPGALARIAIGTPAQASADTQQALDVTIELQDAHGVRVFSRTELTLESTLGEWQTPDLDPKEPGVQVFIDDGIGHFKLLPPANPGRGKLRVTAGAVHAEADLTFMPNLRPLLASGIAEGVLSLHNLNSGSLQQAQSGDGFEREIENASRSFGGNADGAARASLFLKGKILGSDLLTMAYDSDKPGDTPLFRDIQPDQYYPVYGDSSVKGYDAQSTGKLYVRIDHGTSYGLYGDFSTQSDNPARLLTQYSRALNGAKTHVEDGGLTVDGFVSDTSSTQVIDELPANGTSGPYQLSQHNPLVNSQQVDIITRDRNQPSLVLSDTPLTAFTDYAVEVFSGQILLKAPVPSLDMNLNPIYIRVVYEVNGGGQKYLVGGIDLREKLGRDLTLGGTYVRDSNPITRENLGGANFLWSPDRTTSLIGEVAQSQSDLVGTGGAHRLEFKHTDSRIQARVYAVQTDSTFNNPSSTYNAGASEYGAKISAVFDANNRLLIDALKTTTAGTTLQSPLSIPLVGVSESIPGGGSRQGESVALEHTIVKKVKVTAGVRHAESNGVATQALAVGAVPTDYTSWRVRIDAPLPDLPRATAFAQYEQAVDDAALKDTTVGATYQVAPQTKLYATHQTSDSLSGDYALNPSQQNDTTVVGLDTTYMQDGKMFDEYRIGDGIDGRDARAAVGLRNLWTLAPGLGLSTSIQQIHPISGVVTDRATALTGALEYTANPDWKGSTRLEWSKSATSETWLSTLGAAFKINPSITALLRGVDNEQLGLGAGAAANTLRQEQLGFALRPVDSDIWNALSWIEHKRVDNGTLGVGLDIDESANIFSTHVNYQPTAAWVITGRYGIKQALDFASGFTSSYTAQIVGTRSVWDLNEHWDAGLQYFIEYGGNGLASRQQAIGGEVGYLVIKNLWLSIGYNIVGFTDADLASEDYTQRAFYLRLRFKFDENLFKPSNNAESLPANTAVMK